MTTESMETHPGPLCILNGAVSWMDGAVPRTVLYPGWCCTQNGSVSGTAVYPGQLCIGTVSYPGRLCREAFMWQQKRRTSTPCTTLATNHAGLLSTWNVAGEEEELSFYLILNKLNSSLNLKRHMWLVATTMESANKILFCTFIAT